MHGSRQMVAGLLPGYVSAASECSAEVLVCPPFSLLAMAEKFCRDSALQMGGQNLAHEAGGAFTGEMSGSMLVEAGCRYVLVGHSERRTLFGESSELVAAKVAIAMESGLIPIVCVGETLQQRERGETEQVISAQLDAVESVTGIAALENALIAYEPVWAIGTGKTATPGQAQAVHEYIRGGLAGKDETIADGMRILYGGSVKPENAAELFGQPDIDGGLIGGASLSSDEFVSICRAASLVIA